MPMMTTTISSSMRVKPFLLLIQDSPEALASWDGMHVHSPMVKTPQVRRGKVQHGTLGAAKRTPTLTARAVRSYEIIICRYRRKCRRFLQFSRNLRLKSAGRTWRAYGKVSRDRSRGPRPCVAYCRPHSPEP